MLKLSQAYGSVDVSVRNEYSLQGVFIGNECALESCLGTAPGAGSLSGSASAVAGTLEYRESTGPDDEFYWFFSEEVLRGGRYMIGKRVKMQWLVPKGDLSYFQIAKVYGGREVHRRVDGRLVTFTLVPEREVMRLTVTQHYDSVYDARKRKEEYSLQGAFIDNECALKRCRGTAPGLGFQGWFFNPQSWAPTCGRQTTVAGAEVAYYFTGYASLSESLASAESFASEPAAGVRRWLTVGGANGGDVCGASAIVSFG